MPKLALQAMGPRVNKDENIGYNTIDKTIHVSFNNGYINYLGQFDQGLTVRPNPGIMGKFQGNHPQMALIQVSEYNFVFTQKIAFSWFVTTISMVQWYAKNYSYWGL